MLKRYKIIHMLLLLFLFFLPVDVHADTGISKKYDNTIPSKLYRKYGIPEGYSLRILDGYKYIEKIVDNMDRPTEKKTIWDNYKKIFINNNRIKNGTVFYKKHKKKLLDVSKQYDIIPEILVSIIGVESYYGKYRLQYRAIDALGTLGFNYPRRRDYFMNEFKNYIIFTYENGLDPFNIYSSYAGAIGLPQFMPSSIYKYGIDFDGDLNIDLVNSVADSVASIANYLKKNGWENGKPTAILVRMGNNVDMNKVLCCKRTIADFKKLGVVFSLDSNNKYVCKIVALDNGSVPEYWATFDNFHALRSYNPSDKYALAVFLLAKKIGIYL